MPGAHIENEQPEIAVVGGGIVGIVLAVGLLKRGITVKVYEQSRGFREIGAGVAFTSCARRCMNLVDPAVVAAFKSSGSVGLKSADADDPNDYLSWVDGYNQRRPEDPDYETPLFKANAGYKGFAGTRRDMFLESLSHALPEGVVEFRKRLENIRERGEDDKIVLTFSDGTTAEADAVVGCDGLKSQVREYLFGQDNPASYVNYAHQFAYRGLVSMENAINALGADKAKYFTIHLGPGGHMLHYPVANGAMVNVACFVRDPEEWSDRNNLVKPATRADMEKAFEKWNPSVRAMASHFPENIDKWALFDTFDYPAPFFSRGKICLLGDAAHASTPHHGAGACLGIEDSACLAGLLEEVSTSIQQRTATKAQALQAAFETYDAVRRKRAQWFVNSSRRVDSLFESSDWADPAKWVKADTCWEEVQDRSYKVWHFDPDQMLEEAVKKYLDILKSGAKVPSKTPASLPIRLANGTSREASNGVSHETPIAV